MKASVAYGTQGYYIKDGFLGSEAAAAMRAEAVALHLAVSCRVLGRSIPSLFADCAES